MVTCIEKNALTVNTKSEKICQRRMVNEKSVSHLETHRHLTFLYGVLGTVFFLLLNAFYPLNAWGKGIVQTSLKNGDTICLAMMPKFEGFGGRNMPVVLEYGHPAGRSQVFGTAQANATPSLFEDFLLTRVHDYGVTQITGEVADAMETDSYSWVRGITNQINGIMKQTARNLHIMAYRAGDGFRGVAGVVAGALITLTQPEDAANFEVGMSIDSCTGAGAPAGFPDTIAAINRITGVLTSTLAAWPGPVAAADNLFVEGDYTIAAGINMVSGLSAWVPPAAAPGAGLFFGVNRTLDATRLGGLRLLAGAAGMTIEEGLIAGAFQVDQYGGTPTHCFMHPVNYRDLVNALGAKCNYERVQSQHAGVKAPIGFRAVMLDGPKGPVACVSDNAAPLGIAWMLDLSTWVLASLGPAPKLLMRDGNKILRQAAADGYEVRCGYYAQIGCKAPGYNCAITL